MPQSASDKQLQAAKIMQPHEERVVVEKRELDEKLTRLNAFCFGENNTTFKNLSEIDRGLLTAQHAVMKEYSAILAKRIERF